MDISHLDIQWDENSADSAYSGRRSWTAYTPTIPYRLVVVEMPNAWNGKPYHGRIVLRSGIVVSSGEYKTHLTAMRGLVRRLANI
jgi:hypothetical protein